MKAYLEPGEVERLEQAAEYLRDKLLIRLLFHLGCRVSEALGIRVEDIDFKQGTVTIEHLWRSVKYEEVYLKAYQDGREARIGLGNYFRFYNTERPHQTHGYRTPAEVYTSTPVEPTSRGMVESLTSDPFRIAGPNLNIAPILS